MAHLISAFIGIGFGTYLLYYASLALKTGEARYRLQRYTREGQPKDYWSFVTYCIVCGLLACGVSLAVIFLA